MAVKLRLTRIGKKGEPFYRIVAIDSRRKRDGMFIEDLGTYDPKRGELVQFHQERIVHWLDKGAIPTDVVKRLCKINAKQQEKDSAPVV